MKDINNEYISLQKHFINLKKDIDESKIYHNSSVLKEEIINNDKDYKYIKFCSFGEDISQCIRFVLVLISIITIMIIINI